MWSIQAFRRAGRLKLYIGVPMTISSAASSSPMKVSDTPSAFFISGEWVSGAL
jgi:hypothetical protein